MEKSVTEIARPPLTFPKPVAEAVSQAYAGATCILEYGSGGSTVLASEMQGKSISSVESDRSWAERLRKFIESSSATRSIPEILHVDIGPTKAWGHPCDMTQFRRFPRYPFNVWLQNEEIAPDVILIDGRFRVACFLASALMVKKRTVILFDDYVDRPGYHWIERIDTPTRIVDRMAVFDLYPNRIGQREILNLINSALDPS